MGDSEFYVTPATEKHARCLGPCLRQADLEEVLAIGFRDGTDALLQSLAISTISYAAFVDGHLACLFGAVDHRGGTSLGGPVAGRVWMLGSNALKPKAIIRHSPYLVRSLLRRYELLDAWVCAQYAAAIRWLKWLGFELSPVQAYGPLRAPFHHAILRRSTWASPR